MLFLCIIPNPSGYWAPEEVRFNDVAFVDATQVQPHPHPPSCICNAHLLFHEFCIACINLAADVTMTTPIPQPPGVPLLGNIFDVDPSNTWISLQKLWEKYGE